MLKNISQELALTSCKQAFTNHPLTSDQLPGIERYKPKQPIFQHQGDLLIEGDLALDWNESWQGAVGLIVMGDLRIDGNLINANADSGPCLIVQGRLSTIHAVFGGSSVYIADGADISGLLLAHGNDGALTIGEMTEAGLIISDDHATELNTDSPYWNSHQDIIGMPLSDYLHADVELLDSEDWDGVDEDYLDISEKVDADLLIDRINSGLAVLRTADDKRPRRSKRVWQKIIKRYPLALRHIAKDLLKPDLIELALKQDGVALQAIPNEQRNAGYCTLAMQSNPAAFPFIPPALQNEALCQQAVVYDGALLENVAEPYKTPELCRLAIENDDYHYALEATPPELLSEALCLQAVQNDCANLAHVPEHLRSVEVCVAALKQQAAMVLTDVPVAIREEVCRVADYVIQGDPSDEHAVATDGARARAMQKLLE